MSEIVRDKLREVCPVEKMEELSSEEIEIAVRIAFNLIGYKAVNTKLAIQKAYESSVDGHYWLCDFIYDVWRLDK